MNFLALDFDGVISNSIQECLVVGNNAWYAYSHHGNPVTRTEELPQKTVDNAKRIRNYIRSGEDYVYIFMALDQDIEINNQNDFDAFTKSYEGLRETFFDIFYRNRKQFLQIHKQQWIALNPLYDGMQKFLQTFPAQNLFVISTKKTSYIQQILQANNVALIADHLFHANRETPKAEIIQQLLDKHHIDKNAFYFIDDQVDTLIKCEPTGVHCVLAKWGYNTEEQVEKAKQQNIAVMDLFLFYQQFNAIDFSKL
jgi:phosphoglycolate phosphatase-like HAD superfamily hydrolase